MNFCSKPGPIYDPKNRENLMKIASTFENSSNSLGPNATEFWLRNFEKFLKEKNFQIPENSEIFFQFLRPFFFEFPKFKNDLKFDPKNFQIFCFRFKIGLKNFRTNFEKLKTVEIFRKIAENFSEFSVKIQE